MQGINFTIFLFTTDFSSPLLVLFICVFVVYAHNFNLWIQNIVIIIELLKFAELSWHCLLETKPNCSASLTSFIHFGLFATNTHSLFDSDWNKTFFISCDCGLCHTICIDIQINAFHKWVLSQTFYSICKWKKKQFELRFDNA